MDTHDIPPALRAQIEAINTQIIAAAAAKEAAETRLAELHGRVAAPATAAKELEAATDDDGATLAAMADGKIDSKIRKLLDRVHLFGAAAAAAERSIPAAQMALAEAESAMAELLETRKALVADALLHARDDMLVKYAEASRHVQTVAAHLAGIAAAATDATGIHMPLPAGVGTLAMGQRPESRDGQHIPPDAIQWTPLHQCADADIVATSQAAWLAFTNRLIGGAS